MEERKESEPSPRAGLNLNAKERQEENLKRA